MTFENLDQEPNGIAQKSATGQHDVVTLDNGNTADDRKGHAIGENERRPRGFFHLVAELRRRRVCRAATMYAVALWLICQIVELVYPELGLPDWTLKLVIVLGLVGFPIALVLSWLIDITPDGLVVDAPRNTVPRAPVRWPLERTVDICLLATALLIGVQVASEAIGPQTSELADRHNIAVTGFVTPPGAQTGKFAADLYVQVRHELANLENVVVIANEDAYLTAETRSLSGSVSIDGNHLHVTVTLIDNETGRLLWSQVFLGPDIESTLIPVKLARDIVSALPGQRDETIVAASSGYMR